jgi:sulfide:quinone oxidoreductase
MSERIVVLGAGFGGLELATMLSETLGEGAQVTLIDKSDSFVFGFSKLDIMFRGAAQDSVRMYYRDIAKPGVRVLRETITAIDPEARTVLTDVGTHEADVLVIALGADYDMDSTPGLAEVGNEFYSVAGAERLAGIIPSFSRGHAVIGICGAPFKCPPAPSECALMLDDELTARGVRDACEISIVMPLALRCRRHQRRRRRWNESSPIATSSCSAGGGWPRSTARAAWSCSTTTVSCPSTCSSAFPGIARRTW